MSTHTVKNGALEFLCADTLPAPHGFSTRHGGVSEGQLSSLNLGIHRGDAPRNVIENWKRFGAAVGFDWKKTVFTHQIHTDVVRAVDAADCGRGLILPAPECDALITNTPGVTLVAFSADCTLILLQDMQTGAVGAVHSGWRGTALGIVKTTVESMHKSFGTNPGDIRAVIGPCIGQCCFETHRDVPEAMLEGYGLPALNAVKKSPKNEGKFLVDLKKLNDYWLRRAGVSRIEICPECTACAPARFWSHRLVGNARGTLAGVITCPK